MEAITLALPSIVAILFLSLVAHFALGAWKGQGTFAITDRWALVTRFVSAVASCAIAVLIVDWSIVPGFVWPIGMGLLALGVAGATLRWSGLPWFTDNNSRPRRIVGIAADLLISAFFIGVALI